MAVVVTTLQEMSLIVSRRAINTATQMEITRIGVVENMSGLSCPNCGHAIELFGSGGGAQVAQDLDVPLLGRIPISRQRERALTTVNPSFPRIRARMCPRP
jgi:Mrp family chromosome partitioning ATPase